MKNNPQERYVEWQNHCDNLINKMKEDKIIQKEDINLNENRFKCKSNLEIKLKYEHGIINYKNCLTIIFMKDEGAIFINMKNPEIEGSNITVMHYLNPIKEIK